MTKHLKLTGLFLLLALLGLALVTGCGGGSSSSGGGPVSNLTFSGTIVDTNNDRLAGVGVTMTSRRGLRLPLIDSGTRAAYSATTDENGNFTLTGLTAGNYTFSVLPSGGLVFAQVDAGGQVSESVTGAEISVIRDQDQWDEVINNDDSHPFSNQHGYIQVDAGSATEESLSQVTIDTSTGEHYGAIGYFAENPRDADSVVDWSLTQTTDLGKGFLYAVDPDPQIIEAHREGYNFTNQTVDVESGHIHVIFMEGVSTDTYDVGGNLTETDNSTPIAGAEVDLTSRSRNWFKSPRRYTVITDAQGRFDFRNIPEGNYNLRFSKINYVPFNMLLAVDSDMTDIGPILVQEAQWDTVMGDATHPYNANYGYVMVQARRADNESSVPGVVIATGQGGTRGYAQDTVPVTISFAATSTGNTGLAFFYNTGLTSHTFSATKTGYTFSNVSGIVPVAGEIVMTPIIATTYPSGYSLSGNIKEVDGTAIADATVTVVGSGRSALTDANGAFTVSQIATQGEYLVRVTKTNYLPTRTRLDIQQDITGQAYPLLQEAAFDDFHHTNVYLILVQSLRSATGLGLPGCVSSCDGAYTDIGVFPGSNTSIDFLYSDLTRSNGYTLLFDVTELPKGDITYTTTKTGYAFDNGAVDANDLTNGEVYYVKNRGYGPDTFTVSGVVREASGDPATNLTVELLSDPDIHAQTDQNGAFTLENVPYGTQVLRVNHDFNLTDHVKSNTYREITEDIPADAPEGRNLELMCFTRNEFNAMLQGSGQHPDYTYSPVSSKGYLAVMGTLPASNSNIPKLQIQTSGLWTAQGYLEDGSPAVIDWLATYGYTTQPAAVFYEGDAGSHDLVFGNTVYNPGWSFPGDTTAQVFAGELTIREVNAVNYPKRNFSGMVTDADSAPLSEVRLTADRHYDSIIPSLYSVATGGDGGFTFNTALPANDNQSFSLSKTGYLNTRVHTDLFINATENTLLLLDTGGFAQMVNSDDSHPYDADKTYYIVRYLSAEMLPVVLVSAHFDAAPAAGNLGYMNTGIPLQFVWNDEGVTSGNGWAIGYGYNGNSSVRISGTHITQQFGELWAWGNPGSVVEVLMHALIHQ